MVSLIRRGPAVSCGINESYTAFCEKFFSLFDLPVLTPSEEHQAQLKLLNLGYSFYSLSIERACKCLCSALVMSSHLSAISLYFYSNEYMENSYTTMTDDISNN